MLLLVGTIPAAILGVFLESRIKSLFASPYEAAGFLVVNGGLMLTAELLRRRAERRAALDGVGRAPSRRSSSPTRSASAFVAAAIVGACQALAFLPGISRSGVTIGGGWLAGLRHQKRRGSRSFSRRRRSSAPGWSRCRSSSRAACRSREYLAAAVLSGRRRLRERAIPPCATSGPAASTRTAGTASRPGSSAWLCYISTCEINPACRCAWGPRRRLPDHRRSLCARGAADRRHATSSHRITTSTRSCSRCLRWRASSPPTSPDRKRSD